MTTETPEVRQVQKITAATVAAELRIQAHYFDQWAQTSRVDPTNGLDAATLDVVSLSLRARAEKLDPSAGVAEQPRKD